jgi:hypothetical protein
MAQVRLLVALVYYRVCLARPTFVYKLAMLEYGMAMTWIVHVDWRGSIEDIGFTISSVSR